MPRLEVHIHADPDVEITDGVAVRGSVRDAAGTETPFVGWVGLLALLQRAVDAPSVPT